MGWPRAQFFRNHSKEHDFSEFFVANLTSTSKFVVDSAYVLRIHERPLHDRNKKEVRELAEEIAARVLSCQVSAKSPRGIVNRHPVFWHFGPVLPRERDETIPETGIGVEVSGEWDCYENINHDRKKEDALRGYESELSRAAQADASKFKEFVDCRKLFLVQFLGDQSDVLLDEDLLGIVQTTKLPRLIDEVWVAFRDWINAYEYEVGWRQVR